MTLRQDTVLVTGCTGFIAKHIVLELVREGARVRGTLRDRARAEEVRAILAGEGLPPERFEAVEADLTRDEGWRTATQGCRFVLHTASPFPASQPRDRFALVPTAKGGTLRVLEAARASGAERVVLTSSVASIFYGHGAARDKLFGEADFTRVESPDVSAYAVSKTEAEKAAWTFSRDGGPPLATINPSLVLGPALDGRLGTSAALILAMLNGRIPALPDVGFGVVDVRDVAKAHVRALGAPEAAGRRFVVSAGSMKLMGIAETLRSAFPEHAGRLPRRAVPSGLVRFAARLSSRASMLAAELGEGKKLDTSPARGVLGFAPPPPAEAVVALGESLIRLGLVRR